MNNINSINKKEKESKEITVILGKLAGDGYSYIEDTLHERSKIKIPLIYDPQSDFKNSKIEEYPQIKEKSITESQKYSSSDSFMISQKNLFHCSKNQEFPKNDQFNHNTQYKSVLEELDKNSFIIPSCSQWFKMNDINDIEVKANPEFFSGKYPSKTPEVYKEYRNYIIDLYRQNPNSYLSSTTCRRQLAGDACSILRIHTFLEHWGIINFEADPSNKPTNPILAKSFNYRNPVYVDASSFIVKESTPNFGNKIGENAIILTTKQGEEIKTLFPINNNPENLFRSIFNKNALNPTNKINFLAKNYQPKCDLCNKLCGFEWYMLNNSLEIKDSLLICKICFNSNYFPKDLNKEDFEISNIYSIVDTKEKYEKTLKEKFETEKWTLSETMELIDNLEKYGENWDEIIKNLSTTRTKNECILHIMQLPIKENVIFRFSDVKLNKDSNNLQSFLKSDSDSTKLLSQVKDCNALSDQSNPLIQQVVFFSKMFENFTNIDLKKSKEEIESDFNTKINSNNTYHEYILNSLNEKREFLNLEGLKDLIYKTYSKNSENLKTCNNQEKKKLKKIMSLIIYLQVRKIEMKLNYFKEMEKTIQNENQQLKLMDSQIIQDRIRLALKKSEINLQAKKFKDIISPIEIVSNYSSGYQNKAILNGNHSIENNLDLNEDSKKGDYSENIKVGNFILNNQIISNSKNLYANNANKEYSKEDSKINEIMEENYEFNKNDKSKEFASLYELHNKSEILNKNKNYNINKDVKMEIEEEKQQINKGNEKKKNEEEEEQIDEDEEYLEEENEIKEDEEEISENENIEKIEKKIKKDQNYSNVENNNIQERTNPQSNNNFQNLNNNKDESDNEENFQ